MVIVLDSYSEANQNSDAWVLSGFAGTGGSAYGQTFKTPDTSTTQKLNSAKFYLKTAGSTYNLTARVYAVTGTYGTTAVATGAALAESDAVTTGVGAAYALITFTFSGANKISLTTNTAYCLILINNNSDANILMGKDTTAPTHAGNMVYWSGAFAWTASPAEDAAAFYVYGDTPLTISSVSNGSTYPVAGTTYYTAETDVVVYAKPNRGYILSSWTYDTVAQTSKDNRVTVTVTVDTAHTLTPAFTAEYTASNNPLFANLKLHLGKSLGVTDFNVTLHALSLGSQDADTGIPAKSYTDSTIEMLIVTKQDQTVATQIGRYVTLDALGFTTSCIRAWDKVTTATGKRYFITKTTPYLDGSGAIVFYQAELTEEVMQ